MLRNLNLRTLWALLALVSWTGFTGQLVCGSAAAAAGGGGAAAAVGGLDAAGRLTRVSAIQILPYDPWDEIVATHEERSAADAVYAEALEEDAGADAVADPKHLGSKDTGADNGHITFGKYKDTFGFDRVDKYTKVDGVLEKRLEEKNARYMTVDEIGKDQFDWIPEAEGVPGHYKPGTHGDYLQRLVYYKGGQGFPYNDKKDKKTEEDNVFNVEGFDPATLTKGGNLTNNANLLLVRAVLDFENEQGAAECLFGVFVSGSENYKIGPVKLKEKPTLVLKWGLETPEKEKKDKDCTREFGEDESVRAKIGEFKSLFLEEYERDNKPFLTSGRSVPIKYSKGLFRYFNSTQEHRLPPLAHIWSESALNPTQDGLTYLCGSIFSHVYPEEMIRDRDFRGELDFFKRIYGDSLTTRSLVEHWITFRNSAQVLPTSLSIILSQSEQSFLREFLVDGTLARQLINPSEKPRSPHIAMLKELEDREGVPLDERCLARLRMYFYSTFDICRYCRGTIASLLSRGEFSKIIKKVLEENPRFKFSGAFTVQMFAFSNYTTGTC
jgi:hypothetical protein